MILQVVKVGDIVKLGRLQYYVHSFNKINRPLGYRLTKKGKFDHRVRIPFGLVTLPLELEVIRTGVSREELV